MSDGDGLYSGTRTSPLNQSRENPVVDIVDKALRMGEGHQLKKLENVAKAVNALEDEISALSDEDLKAQTPKFKQQIENGKSLDDIMPEAFATVREVSKRTLGQRHFDVQLMGGAALHWGNIAEMKTGEGKTLVATLPTYLNALEAKACTWSPSTTTSPATRAS